MCGSGCDGFLMVDDSAVGQGDEQRWRVMIEEEEERVEVCGVEE